jgi:hypothetical protein
MKKIVLIFMLALGFAWNCHAQTWTYVQDSLATGCSAGASSCTISGGNGMIPTIAGTVWVAEVQTTNNVTITSVTGGGGAWTLCPASSCHLFSSTPARNVDMAYNLTGSAGTSQITFNLSGGSGSILGANFFEFLPPPGSTASFDTAGTTSSSSCAGTCTGVALTLSGTDVVLQSMHANNASAWNSWSSPYTTLPLGEGLFLNATSGAAPTVKVSGTGAVVHAIAFKSSLGTFSSPTLPMSVVNFTNINVNCAPNCSLTIPSTSAGNLLYLQAGNIHSSHISSVSGGGTWVIPSGANTCQITLGGSDALSCGYVSSGTAGATSLSVTMSGSGAESFAVWEVTSSTGPFAFDTQGSAQNSASFSPKGVALSLTGTNDAIFQSIFVPGGTSSVSFYPQPRIPGQATQFFNNEAANAVLLNTAIGVQPVWENQQNSATVVAGVAFRTGTAPAPPAPPTGLAAVVN